MLDECVRRSTLLRVVVKDGVLVPDERAVLPGRGAWLHTRRECLERAERTRSFARAFRRAVDPAPLLASW